MGLLGKPPRPISKQSATERNRVTENDVMYPATMLQVNRLQLKVGVEPTKKSPWSGRFHGDFKTANAWREVGRS